MTYAPPNTPPPFRPSLFVTRVKWRSPEWKAHTTEGHANRAAAYHSGAEVWTWDVSAEEWRRVR